MSGIYIRYPNISGGSSTTITIGDEVVDGTPNYVLYIDGSGNLANEQRLSVTRGGTGATTFTLGSVVFAGASGVYTQDNANFFWDDTNNRLGIGTTSPSVSLDTTGSLRIRGLSTAGPVITDASGNLTSEAALAIARGGTGQTSAANAINALLPSQGGHSGEFLTTNGTIASWGASAAAMAIGSAVTSGTTGSILFIGAGPVLAQDNANFFWDDSNNRLGVGIAAPQSWVQISSNGLSVASALSDPVPLDQSELTISGAAADVNIIGSSGTTIRFMRSNGTVAVPTTVADTNIIGQVQSSGFDGTDRLTLTNISSVVNGAVTTGSIPTDLLFGAGTNAATERMRIKSTGVINIAGLNAAGVVHTDSSGNLSTSTILNADVNASAAIAYSKLAALTSAHILVGSAGNVATDVAVTGDIAITNAGVTSYSGVVPIAKGGTNKALTLAAGGLVWTDADSFEVGAAGTASDWALSGGTGAPTFSSTTTTAKLIDGSADAIQLIVQGNGTQTSDIFVVEKSDGTDLLEVTNVNGTKIRGTTTNDAAAAGFVGEYVESIVSAVNFPTTNTLGDLTSISLTAGDWDVTSVMDGIPNGATVTYIDSGISTTSGNSSTGLTYGSNRLQTLPPSSATDTYVVIPSYRISLSGTTTVYLKFLAVYAVAQAKASGRLSARRVR